jgi:hypothetical protein
MNLTALSDVTLYSLVDISKLLHKVDNSLTYIHGVTCYKTVTFKVVLLTFINLDTAKYVWKCNQA